VKILKDGAYWGDQFVICKVIDGWNIVKISMSERQKYGYNNQGGNID
jgi:hypothetical protein